MFSLSLSFLLLLQVFIIINTIIIVVIIIIDDITTFTGMTITMSIVCCCAFSYSTSPPLLSPYPLSLSQSLRTRCRMATPPHTRGSSTASRKTFPRVSCSGTTGSWRGTTSSSRHSNSRPHRSSRSSTSRFSHSSIRMSCRGDLKQRTSSGRCSNPSLPTMWCGDPETAFEGVSWPSCRPTCREGPR